jgi:hypothetical protein
MRRLRRRWWRYMGGRRRGMCRGRAGIAARPLARRDHRRVRRLSHFPRSCLRLRAAPERFIVEYSLAFRLIPEAAEPRPCRYIYRSALRDCGHSHHWRADRRGSPTRHDWWVHHDEHGGREEKWIEPECAEPKAGAPAGTRRCQPERLSKTPTVVWTPESIVDIRWYVSSRVSSGLIVLVDGVVGTTGRLVSS